MKIDQEYREDYNARKTSAHSLRAMDSRKNDLMRGYVDAGISAAKFSPGRSRMLLKSLDVPMAVINRVIAAVNGIDGTIWVV